MARAVAVSDPSSSGTKALYNKFYDDKSTFTGVYAARFGIEARVADRKHWKEGRPRAPSASTGWRRCLTRIAPPREDARGP